MRLLHPARGIGDQPPLGAPIGCPIPHATSACRNAGDYGSIVEPIGKMMPPWAGSEMP